MNDRVRKATNSEYSPCYTVLGTHHTQMSVGARNIVRYIFNEPNDICVLGVKPEYLTPIINDGN